MIAKSGLNRCWQWQIGGCVALVGTLSIAINTSVLAQIVPDTTLGAEGSVVTPNANVGGLPADLIQGGARRGANLFHSFSDFNVGNLQRVYFANPAGVQNILSRVTGTTLSNILGTLGVDGTANLFLINPNGIVFGPAASLDVQGSFLATTANAVKLGDDGLFSASQPETSNLLSVNPSALWFNAVAAQPIVNRSQASSLIGQPNSARLAPGLQVRSGRTLALVGGDVRLEGGRLTAARGRIELGSVTGGGQVSLTQSGNGFVLGYDALNEFGNIKLSNGAFVDVSGAGGGSIQIRGGRLEMTQGSNIWADTLGAQNGGGVLVRATEVVLSEGSLLTSDVSRTGTGTGGELTIDTGRLLVRDGARVSAITSGQGKGGNLQIMASDAVELIGASANGQIPSSLAAQSQGTGNAGDLRIDTRRLLVRDGARISTNTTRSGKGGSLLITASDSVEVIGTSTDGQLLSVLTAQSLGSGNAGDLTIDTRRLLVRDGAQVSAATVGSGKGGSLLITASDAVELIGTSTDGRFPSALSTLTEGKGNGGNINISTGSFSLTRSAQLNSSTSGQGNAGDINITTGSLSLTNGSGLVIGTSGEGDAGSINVNAQEMLLSSDAALVGDVNPNAKGWGGNINLNVTGTILLRGEITPPIPGFLWTGESTRITIGVLPDGIGSGGTLNINAGALVLTDGAIVKNSTQGQGNAGNINVNARVVDISGSVPNSGLPSGLFTSTDTDGRAGDIVIDTGTFRIADGAALSARSKGDGQGGNIMVNATSFEATGGGQLTTTTFGSGQAGNIFVNATDRVTITGSDRNYTNRISKFPNPISLFVANAITETGPNSGLFANTETNSTGNGGDIKIVTSNFNLTDSARISASTSGSGRGGNLTINTGNLTATNGTIATSSDQSSGGSITITASNIRLFGNSDITSRVNEGAGGGGNIYLKAGSILAFGDSDILAFARDGSGGNITLDTKAFFGQNYRPAPRNTDPATLDGNNRVDVNATGTLSSGIITLPDTTFIQNSLSELPENRIDTNALLATSCIVRRNQPTQGSFMITGAGGLPQRPGDVQMSSFPTVDVETLPSDSTSLNPNSNRPWQKGDPIVEPQGVYRLPNGKLVLSRECP